MATGRIAQLKFEESSELTVTNIELAPTPEIAQDQ
jgi:hypothetical protein